MDDLKQLKYLDRCIRDTLRLYPSVPVIGRRSSEDQPIGMLHLLNYFKKFLVVLC